jgi:predicted nuclease with RNAse H fold
MLLENQKLIVAQIDIAHAEAPLSSPHLGAPRSCHLELLKQGETHLLD